ncbi:MAG: hypothetical protein QM791_15525 [Ferruginibacter sp.]
MKKIIDMYSAQIKRTFNTYSVFCEGKMLLYAQDKGNYFQHRKLFFDNNNKLIAEAKQPSFLFITSSCKITFSDRQISWLQEKSKYSSLKYNYTEYCIQHKRDSVEDHLLKNGIHVGRLVRIKEGVSEYENEILCGLMEDCLIFSLLSILVYDFDVN